MFLFSIALTWIVLSPLYCEALQCYHFEESAIEKQIDRLENKKRNWASGCEWVLNWCKPNNYDCSWIITASLRKFKGYDGKKLNSQRISEIWIKLKRNQAKRGDIAYFKPMGDSMGHVAIIVSDYNNGGVVILDGVLKPWKMTKRFIRFWNNGVYYITPIRL